MIVDIVLEHNNLRKPHTSIFLDYTNVLWSGALVKELAKLSMSSYEKNTLCH